MVESQRTPAVGVQSTAVGTHAVQRSEKVKQKGSVAEATQDKLWVHRTPSAQSRSAAVLIVAQ